MAVAAMNMVAPQTAAQPDGHVPKPRRPSTHKDDDHHTLYWLFSKFRSKSEIIAIESPKPLGKRAKRRLRGRNKEAARLARARVANYIWEF